MKAYGVDRHSGKWCDVRHCTSCGGKALRRASKGGNPGRNWKKKARQLAKRLARGGGE